MVTLSKEIIELVVAFGTFYVAVMVALVPMLRGTRKELKETRAELKGDIDALRTDLKGDMGKQHTGLKSDIDGLRTELKDEIGKLEAKVDKEGTALRTEMRAINDRLDGTNMRVDRLVDALLTAPEKVS